MNSSGPSNFTPQELQAMRLISVLCDDQLTPEQALELEDLVRVDPEIRKLYVRWMLLHAGLYQYASALGSSVLGPIANAGMLRLDEPPEESDQPGLNETMVLPAMSEPAEDFDLQADEQPEPFPATHYNPPAQTSPFLNLKTGLAAILILGLGVGMLTYFLNSPGPSINPVAPQIAVVPPVVSPVAAPAIERPPAVAFLDTTVNPVWASSDPLPADGGLIAGQMLTLTSGAVQLKIGDGGQGGKVVIEGPVQIQLVSYKEIALHYGKLAATVPGGGLVIQTPGGKITDLGTEFGVSVKGANTEVAVFKGRVSAALSSTAATQPVKELSAGQAAEMSGIRLNLAAEGAVKQRYICSLKNQAVTSLDVTDLINGGDGTTRNRGIAVDSLTGSIGVPAPTGMRQGDGQYHRIQGYPVVDGAFVPDGNKAAMVVDSAGDRFNFEPTTNQTYNYIWTGGHIPWPDEQGISAVIDNLDYSGPDHAIICEHSNNALTLDLNAVRRMYPDRELAQFNCLFANSYINGWFGAAKVNPVASAYVLIDGKSRYEKLHFTNQDGTFHVALPLLKTDRFLTLVCTDAGTEIDHDWILWADAKIDLAPPAQPLR